MGSLIGGKIGSDGGQFKRENRARTRSLIAISLCCFGFVRVVGVSLLVREIINFSDFLFKFNYIYIYLGQGYIYVGVPRARWVVVGACLSAFVFPWRV